MYMLTYPPIKLPYRLLAFSLLLAPAMFLADLAILLLALFGIKFPIIWIAPAIALLILFRRAIPEGAFRIQLFARHPGLSLRNKIVLYFLLPAWGILGVYWMGGQLWANVAHIVSSM